MSQEGPSGGGHFNTNQRAVLIRKTASTEQAKGRSRTANVSPRSRLILQADIDFDSNGLALMDEFSDAISACIVEGFDGGLDVVSVTPLPDAPAKQTLPFDQ